MLILHRFGGWLPRDHRVLQDWLNRHITSIDERKQKGVEIEIVPHVERFKKLIESNAAIYMGFHEMFNQVPTKPPYNNDPTGKPQVLSYFWHLSLDTESPVRFATMS